MNEKKPQKGVFWLLDDGTLLAFPFDEKATWGLSKSGDNYNHKLLWEQVKPRGCGKAFDYYPRGRVEVSNKGKPIVYMNPNIGEEVVPQIMEIFGLRQIPKIHYDGSEHYKCHLDRG